jgi:hypothetical protein
MITTASSNENNIKKKLRCSVKDCNSPIVAEEEDNICFCSIHYSEFIDALLEKKQGRRPINLKEDDNICAVSGCSCKATIFSEIVPLCMDHYQNMMHAEMIRTLKRFVTERSDDMRKQKRQHPHRY